MVWIWLLLLSTANNGSGNPYGSALSLESMLRIAPDLLLEDEEGLKVDLFHAMNQVKSLHL